MTEFKVGDKVEFFNNGEYFAGIVTGYCPTLSYPISVKCIDSGYTFTFTEEGFQFEDETYPKANHIRKVKQEPKVILHPDIKWVVAVDRGLRWATCVNKPDVYNMLLSHYFSIVGLEEGVVYRHDNGKFYKPEPEPEPEPKRMTMDEINKLPLEEQNRILKDIARKCICEGDNH